MQPFLTLQQQLEEKSDKIKSAIKDAIPWSKAKGRPKNLLTGRKVSCTQFSQILNSYLKFLKYILFLIFPTHPEIKPSAYKYPIFCFGGLRPP